MVHLVQRLTNDLAPRLHTLGLSPHSVLLLGQAGARPGSTPAELARACGLSPQRVSGILQEVEEAGAVTRQGRRGRGRRTSVHLTARGEQVLASCAPLLVEAGSREALGLTDEEVTMLTRLLTQALIGQGEDLGDVVVLVDDEGAELGTAPRMAVHTDATPLHLAFSTYLFDDRGRILMTRRALAKRTWGGVWTNSACGHLLPGETPVEAAMRRVPDELGVAPTQLRVALPEFRYRAVDASGIVENEICPVMVGRIDPNSLALNPDEVAEHAWMDWDEVRTTASDAPHLLSPWCVEQIAALGPNLQNEVAA